MRIFYFGVTSTIVSENGLDWPCSRFGWGLTWSSKAQDECPTFTIYVFERFYYNFALLKYKGKCCLNIKNKLFQEAGSLLVRVLLPPLLERPKWAKPVELNLLSVCHWDYRFLWVIWVRNIGEKRLVWYLYSKPRYGWMKFWSHRRAFPRLSPTAFIMTRFTFPF
jgi:hypothetical protein